MNESLLKLLQRVDTPTVCNAIEVAQGKRGFDRFTKQTMLISDTRCGAMVGYAKTAQIAALEPAQESADVIRERRMAYYRYMSESPFPSVAVLEDIDFPNAIGAYWGELNTNIHKGFGMSGVVTNGVMRDLGDLPENFPVLAGSIGPSHGFVHVKTIDQPVSVMGLNVEPGELIHADRHGALVIPNEVLPGLETAITTLLANEQIVLKATKQDDFDFEAFEKAWAEFERVRT
ncbi:putative Dimethylmenaquinone methyltransferase [Vibrio nigripulchritudo SO65]|uniref:RraA family protein n=1 Tax=Vibrio nigripulchritudo TaxID=28173 RepID=UPI0003B182A0|nr:RraA family protein [Vibrio nigripulchritudo]KJY73594.1 acyl transferase [Vibrio nigripulchritudo]CCN34239.1 putative Dimethylmenaquinone methyltransferase [Vibrio nigripulchritudo AM115]CCN44079.1 putative Dimethylmenaquinone methyltransferase [Vibrio nigripulchritudo FTn2]CCN64278.1 putative Dimethylmenaquinone methyltransferase [Vibrio nigripulchritudo POn4]CCN78481.1 putative Dimethylmenaquinone methyltransferase [Vibrio nigripulchritudo SO65]